MALSMHRESNKQMDLSKYVRYTPKQVEALERVYSKCPKPSSMRRQQLIRECPILSNIEPKQIKVWFQNRMVLMICALHDLLVFVKQHQFVAVTEWSGGLYVSPTMAGSRPGGLIAGAWAAMMSLGLEGYLEKTRKLMEVSKRIQKGIKEIPELFLIGRPDMTIVAFGSNDVDIFEVNDIMSSKGWHLNALQRPNSIHICVTLQHATVVDDFLEDLRDSMQTDEMMEKPTQVVLNFGAITNLIIMMRR